MNQNVYQFPKIRRAAPAWSAELGDTCVLKNYEDAITTARCRATERGCRQVLSVDRHLTSLIQPRFRSQYHWSFWLIQDVR